MNIKSTLAEYFKKTWEANVWAIVWLISLFWGQPLSTYFPGGIIAILLFGVPVYVFYAYWLIKEKESRARKPVYEVVIALALLALLIYLNRDNLPGAHNKIILLFGLFSGLGSAIAAPIAKMSKS